MQINERYNPNMGHIPMNFAPENPQPEKPKTSGVKKFFKWVGIAFAALFVIGLIGSIVNPPEEAEQVAVEQEAPTVEPVAEEAAEAPAPTAEPVAEPAVEEASVEEAPEPPAAPSAESAIKEALPDATVQDLGDQLNVVFPISDNLTKGFRIIGAQSDTLDIIKAAKQAGYPGTVYIEGTFPMVDAYGAESTDSIIFLTYSPETVARIQPDTIPQDKIWDVADTAGIHPEMRK